MAVKYIEVEKIKCGWAFHDWTNVMQSDLHEYFDSHLIKFRNEFVMIRGHDMTYFIHGFTNERQARDFAIWYHTRPEQRTRVCLLD